MTPAPPDLLPDTRRALEALYEQLAAPTPRAIEGCPCCIDTRGTDVLLMTPLRQLTGQQLWHYASGVFLTVGSSRDFRYLLPRILELSAGALGDTLDPAIVLGKLHRADWRTWTSDDQRAVEAVIDAWVDEALRRDLAEAEEWWPGLEIEDVFCGAACAGLPLHRWAARLQRPDLAAVVETLRGRLRDSPSSFWEAAPGGLAELSAVLGTAPAG